MALVSCPECQKEVSTQALACPQCAFPFPGKQANVVEQSRTKLHACLDCGGAVSKHAQTCPHCGVTLMGEQRSVTTHEDPVQETWLCPHCGVPYTRKVKRREDTIESPQGTSSIIQPAKGLQMSEVAMAQDHNHANLERLPTTRRRSPLWQNSSVRAEGPSPRYPRSRKKSIIVGLIILILVAASIVLGSLWQRQGIHPLDLFRLLVG